MGKLFQIDGVELAKSGLGPKSQIDRLAKAGDFFVVDNADWLVWRAAVDRNNRSKIRSRFPVRLTQMAFGKVRVERLTG